MNEFIKQIGLAFSNESVLNFINTILVAVTSFALARYTASKPNRQNIKDSQFKNVYLPLFKIVKDVPQNLSLEEALHIYNQVNAVLEAYYELVFPELHNTNCKFRMAIKNNQGFRNEFASLKHQISVDYELLRKSLGYPSANFFSIFSRMTARQKFEKVFSFIDVFWVFVPLILLLVLFPYGGTIAFSVSIALYAVLALVLYMINKRRH